MTEMPRPRTFRRVMFRPDVTYFKPRGIPLASLEDVILNVDEFEAVRLKDLEGLEQEECAKKMGISQPTFHRMVLTARRKIAEAMVEGKAIKIEGGSFRMATQEERGRFGRRRGNAAGPGGFCICPKCRHKEPHVTGEPCYTRKCPRCGRMMAREGIG